MSCGVLVYKVLTKFSVLVVPTSVAITPAPFPAVAIVLLPPRRSEQDCRHRRESSVGKVAWLLIYRSMESGVAFFSVGHFSLGKMSVFAVDVQEWQSKEHWTYVVRNQTQELVRVKLDQIMLQSAGDIFYSCPSWVSVPSGKSASYILRLKKEVVGWEFATQFSPSTSTLTYNICCVGTKSKNVQDTLFSRTITFCQSEPFWLHLNVQVNE
jgi:hypothetical protein